MKTKLSIKCPSCGKSGKIFETDDSEIAKCTLCGAKFNVNDVAKDQAIELVRKEAKKMIRKTFKDIKGFKPGR